MADNQPTTTDEGAEEPKAKGPGMIVWAILGLISAGGGFAVPFLLSSAKSPEADAATQTTTDGEVLDEVVFLPVEEVIVNLDEGRLNRYLRLRISLQIAKSDEATITALLEQRKAIVKNWLLSHLSDKGMDDIRGAAGQNRLRREIQDQFNTILFPDGYDRIHDVLFEEFNIQ